MSRRSFSCWKNWAAPYTREDYGRQFNNTQDAAYLKLNPNGKVPTLVDGDTVIWESNTILRYLATSIRKDTLYPSRARGAHRGRALDGLAAGRGQLPVRAGVQGFEEGRERARRDVRGDAKELAAQLSILDGALAGKAWIAGKDFTIADVALGPIMHRCLDFPIALPALSNLKAWREKLKERPAFRRRRARDVMRRSRFPLARHGRTWSDHPRV
jgi:glutathione S-transferase